jgi:hypothetical protein
MHECVPNDATAPPPSHARNTRATHTHHTRTAPPCALTQANFKTLSFQVLHTPYHARSADGQEDEEIHRCALVCVCVCCVAQLLCCVCSAVVGACVCVCVLRPSWFAAVCACVPG